MPKTIIRPQGKDGHDAKIQASGLSLVVQTSASALASNVWLRSLISGQSRGQDQGHFGHFQHLTCLSFFRLYLSES
jgi:hypothetical protein